MAISFLIEFPWAITVSIAVSYLSWRVWRFTLSPLWNKDKPRDLPYWIPILGHTIGFFQDQNQVLETAREHFDDSKEPYSITIAGQAIYIVTAPRDVAAVYKDTSAISWDLMVVDLHRLVNMSDQGMNILFSPSLQEKWSSDKKTRPIFLEVLMKIQHHQLLDAEKVDELLYVGILPLVAQGLDLHPAKHNFTPSTTVMSRDGGSVTASLMGLCTKIILEAMIQAYFGKSIWRAYPNIVTDYLDWEHRNWKILFQLPSFMSQDAIKTKDNLVAGLENYFNLAKDEKEDCSFYIKTVETMAAETGMGSRDLAAVIMLQLWAILANVAKVSFWMTSQLVFDRDLMRRVRVEMAPALKDTDNGAIDYEYLDSQCPLLGSIFTEVLRQVVSAPMARDVLKSTVIGGKVLQKGHKLLVPLSQLHRDRSTWGHDPDTFHASRFHDNPKLLKSLSLRPFGGGTTLCPGRFFAKRLVVAFVGSFLSRYDVRLTDPEARFPRVDNSKPSPGAVNVMSGDDVILSLNQRGKEAKEI